MERSPVQLGVGTLNLTEEDVAAVMEVLCNNRLSYGPKSREFEREFAALHDASYAVLVNSGTSALTLALTCLREVEGWGEDVEVIVPALTFVATANVVLEQGWTPVFVDCDPRTYNIDPHRIEEKITPRTKLIIPVHLFGLTADMDPILEISQRHNLRIVEDSCETVGARYKRKKAGSFGVVSCFSTYVAHILTTGVGGLAVTRDARCAEIIRSLANHGRDSIYVSIDDDKDIDGAAFQEVIRRRFRFIRRGYSFRATEMEAVLGLLQLRRLPQVLQVRRRNAAFLSESLRRFENVLQLPWFPEDTQEHSFMMYPIVIRKGSPFAKHEIVQHLEQWNVETRDMLPLINQPVYANLGIREEEYPVASWVNGHGFYIGCHQDLSKENLQYIVHIFEQFFRESSLP